MLELAGDGGGGSDVPITRSLCLSLPRVAPISTLPLGSLRLVLQTFLEF